MKNIISSDEIVIAVKLRLYQNDKRLLNNKRIENMPLRTLNIVKVNKIDVGNHIKSKGIKKVYKYRF